MSRVIHYQDPERTQTINVQGHPDGRVSITWARKRRWRWPWQMPWIIAGVLLDPHQSYELRRLFDQYATKERPQAIQEPSQCT